MEFDVSGIARILRAHGSGGRAASSAAIRVAASPCAQDARGPGWRRAVSCKVAVAVYATLIFYVSLPHQLLCDGLVIQ
jgi:hypothetical protein